MIYTVGQLVEKLKMLPPDATIWIMHKEGTDPWCGEVDDPFVVWEKDGVVRLYIDDALNYHPEVERHACSLMSTGNTWDRINNL